MFILVCQSSCKVVLYVGVHDGSEVVETAVPEQVNDEDLSTQIHINCKTLPLPKSHNTNFNL